MYKVIVADDEEVIRRGLVERVDWEKCGFKVIGEAENGADALELVEQLEPDLIITDIRMPFLSGIELARQIRSVRPMVSIVFLSGFDDFSYAQQAIQYNIISYLLKPITAKEFETELKKIKQTLDKKFEEFLNVADVKHRLEKSEFIYPLLLDGYLKTNANEREVRKAALDFGLLKTEDGEGICFSVILTQIMDEKGVNCTNKSNVDSVDMLAKKYVNCISCYLKGRIVTIIVGTERDLNKYTHILTEEIVQSVERIMQLKCIIGVGRIVNEILMCRECYIDAMNAIYYANNTESNVFFIADEEQSVNFNHDEIQVAIEELERLLRGGENEELTNFLNDIEDRGSSGVIPREMFWYLVSQITSTVFRVVYTIVGEKEINYLQSMYKMENMTSHELTLLEFIRIKELCFEAKKLIVEKRKESSNQISVRVLEIIELQYMNQELSVQYVANQIGVSPNYLSSVIKKDTGSNFVELLTKKRITKAEELLLKNDIKIREVAEKCGYADQYYFSHCFKKITGKSPGAYRKLNEK